MTTVAVLLSLAIAQGQSALAPDALLRTLVTGLERSQATSEIIEVKGQPFRQALRVVLKSAPNETNATQLTLSNQAPIKKGDVLMASFFIRGSSPDGPARVEFMFEKATNPWTKSVTQGASGGQTWRKITVPFTSAEDYAPDQAMASIRLALQVQTVEIGGLEVINYGDALSLDDLVQKTALSNPVGNVTLTVDKVPRQLMEGLGGNFCQARYGSIEPLDAVGKYCLDNLQVAHARIGLPLNNWTPQPGVYRDDAQAKASFLALQEMQRRKIPVMVSIWEGPVWMQGGRPEASGRVLGQEMYNACAEAIARYLQTARDKYKVEIPYVSFNEPDYGVNFKFSSAQLIDFMKVSVAKFRSLGLKTKWIVADTANGGPLYNYAKPILEDKELAPHLGPIAFHSWDALSASDSSYKKIAELGKLYGKPIWCLEAGHDAQLWQKPDPWRSWDNALRLGLAYERTLRLSQASLMDYWTYQNNYTLVNPDSLQPYSAFQVMKQMDAVFAKGRRVRLVKSSSEDVKSLASMDSKGSRPSLFILNSSGPGMATLPALAPAGAKFWVKTSSASGNVRVRATTNKAGELKVSLPARSATSIEWVSSF